MIVVIIYDFERSPLQDKAWLLAPVREEGSQEECNYGDDNDLHLFFLPRKMKVSRQIDR